MIDEQLRLVGIIEAKAEHKDIPSVIDYRGKDYCQVLSSGQCKIRNVIAPMHGRGLRATIKVIDKKDFLAYNRN